MRVLRAAALLLASLLLAAPAAGAAPLTILHVNDVHGALLPTRPAAGAPEEGGAARLAALVRAKRTPATLFLAAGDLMQGTNLSNLFAGRPMIEALNLMGLDASAVGNHEFDNGQEIGRASCRERVS
jgi:2',3'-cyclic-nucleotide 2'-phosphodiesterase (5'-nucleotidase family)